MESFKVKKIVVLMVFTMFLISGCESEESVSEAQGKHKENGSTKNGSEVKQLVPLSFQTVNNQPNVNKVSVVKSKRIISEQSISSGKVLIYTKKDDDKNLFGAFVGKDITYDLGVIGGRSPGNKKAVFSIKKLNLLNKSIVRIKGVFGANAPIQNYYSIEDGKIKPFLRVDTGNAMEVDLDGDGTSEIVSMHGTPVTGFIYRLNEGKFEVTNINEGLGAMSVMLTEVNDIRAFYKGSEDPVEYQYKSGMLKPVN